MLQCKDYPKDKYGYWEFVENIGEDGRTVESLTARVYGAGPEPLVFTGSMEECEAFVLANIEKTKKEAA